MSEIKVSVIVPVYNCEKYLKTSMGDILTQTYKNIELILVNDGSTDGSYEICKDIASQDSRVKIINKPQSEGAGPARNDGIDASCGEYIMFLDCDDRIESNMVEKLLTASLDNNCDVAICGYETYVEDVENGENDVFSPEKKLYLDNEVKVLFAEYFPEGIVGYLWNKLYKADIIHKNNLRFPDMRRLQDGVFNVEFFGCAASCCTIEDVLYHYRLNAQTDMFRKLPNNYYDLIKQFSQSFIEKRKEWSIPKSTINDKITVFFLNELGSCIENTFSPLWDMDKTARRGYYESVSEDAFFKEIFRDANVNLGRYRESIVKRLSKKQYGLLDFTVRTKLFVKLRMKKLFYFFKRGNNK